MASSQRGAAAGLALLALLLALLQCAAAQPGVPPMPSWAKGPNTQGPGAWKDFAIKQGEENRALVAAANAALQRWDFLMYGDSITQLIKRNGKEAWARLFPPTTATGAPGWRAAPLGISGNDIEDLAWRLWSGAERPIIPPRVVALLIGLNNVQGRQLPGQTVGRLEEVVKYLQAAFPQTKLVLVSLIPNAKFDHTALNTQYWTLSWRRGIAWAACGRDINPADPAQLYDGTHPTPLGIDKLMRCVAPHVYQLIRQTKGRAG